VINQNQSKDHRVNAWNSQFEKPSIGVLVKGLDPEIQSFYQDFRLSMVEILHTKPKIEWMGATLGWSENIVPDEGGLIRSVHLVADPINPRVEIALSKAFFEAHPPSSLPKQLYAGLSTATCIGHQAWCSWSLSSQDNAEAIKQVVELAHGGCPRD
jgi:hypothetical protein